MTDIQNITQTSLVKKRKVKTINDDGEEISMLDGFYISWVGSKRLEVKFFERYLPIPDTVNTIIEPFAGSSAVSYHMFMTNYQNKSYVINDTDKDLISLYNWAKQGEMDELIHQLNSLKDSPIFESSKNYRDFIQQDGMVPLMIRFTYHGIRPNMAPTKNKKFPDYTKYKYYSYNTFLQRDNTQITSRDWRDVMEEYKNDSTAFIFLDPPYIASCNSYYQDLDQELEVLYEDMAKYLVESRAKIMVVINNRLLNRLLFKDYIRGKYEKIYAMTKRKDEHLIITNY